MVMNEDRWITVGLVAMVAFFGFCVYMGVTSHQRFMDECQADGHKRYECEAMEGGGHQAVPVIIIPVHR